MKTMNFNYEEFNLRKFLTDYDSKIRLVLGINELEPLGIIVEFLEHDTLNIIFDKEVGNLEELINKIENEEIALFMPLGLLGDRSGTYLRLINMIEYRVSEGKEEKPYTNKELFKVNDEILDTGDLIVSSDSTIGIVLAKINNKLFINFAHHQCGSCLEHPTLVVKENTGSLASKIQEYLLNYKI